jgi:FKBP12-rapamycin complex-associated protein
VKLSGQVGALRKAWESSARVTKDDWAEWMRHFSVELLAQSPSPALRACHTLAQVRALRRALRVPPALGPRTARAWRCCCGPCTPRLPVTRPRCACTSHAPAVRAAFCAQVHPQMARELFAAGFVSCWSELDPASQDQLVRSLEAALASPTIPPGARLFVCVCAVCVCVCVPCSCACGCCPPCRRAGAASCCLAARC